jgi:deoxyribonuclease-4
MSTVARPGSICYLDAMARPPLLGSHMSIAGGVHTAFERGMRCGCSTMQVFVKNGNQWSARAPAQPDIDLYNAAASASSIAPVVAHASYLINLCATSSVTLHRSRDAYCDELQRCTAFGIAALIFHPGAHMGAGEDEGIRRIADSLNGIHERTPGVSTLTTLECTAGQGTALGYRFEHLRKIIDGVEQRKRMRVCLDTCHLFAAGYEISTEAGWEKTFGEFDAVVGFPLLAAIHVNDSRREFDSRIDRHEHIGKGLIGLTAFRMLMNDPRFQDIPKILETEKSEDMHEDVENMRILKSLVGILE